MKLSSVCRISTELEFRSENNFIWKELWFIVLYWFGLSQGGGEWERMTLNLKHPLQECKADLESWFVSVSVSPRLLEFSSLRPLPAALCGMPR